MRRIKLSITTDGSGNATAYTPRVAGKIHSIQYVKDGSNAYSNGVDFAVTSEATGENIWTESDVNASAVRYPRAPTHTQAGVAATLDGTRPALDKVAVAGDRIKVVIAQGGASKVGALHILMD
jgi:hypothetical protein